MESSVICVVSLVHSTGSIKLKLQHWKLRLKVFPVIDAKSYHLKIDYLEKQKLVITGGLLRAVSKYWLIKLLAEFLSSPTVWNKGMTSAIHFNLLILDLKGNTDSASFVRYVPRNSVCDCFHKWQSHRLLTLSQLHFFFLPAGLPSLQSTSSRAVIIRLLRNCIPQCPTSLTHLSFTAKPCQKKRKQN